MNCPTIHTKVLCCRCCGRETSASKDKTKIRSKLRYDSAGTVMEISHDMLKQILFLVYKVYIYEVYSSLNRSFLISWSIFITRSKLTQQKNLMIFLQIDGIVWILTEFCCADNLESSSFIHELKTAAISVRNYWGNWERHQGGNACRRMREQYIPMFYSDRKCCL